MLSRRSDEAAVAEAVYGWSSHGLIGSMPQCSKSRVSLVATAPPRLRAIAAICASNTPTGRPAPSDPPKA